MKWQEFVGIFSAYPLLFAVVNAFAAHS